MRGSQKQESPYLLTFVKVGADLRYLYSVQHVTKEPCTDSTVENLGVTYIRGIDGLYYQDKPPRALRPYFLYYGHRLSGAALVIPLGPSETYSCYSLGSDKIEYNGVLYSESEFVSMFVKDAITLDVFSADVRYIFISFLK